MELIKVAVWAYLYSCTIINSILINLIFFNNTNKLCSDLILTLDLPVQNLDIETFLFLFLITIVILNKLHY